MWIILFINSIYLKKIKKRLIFLNKFNLEKNTSQTFSEKNLNKVFYF